MKTSTFDPLQPDFHACLHGDVIALKELSAKKMLSDNHLLFLYLVLLLGVRKLSTSTVLSRPPRLAATGELCA